MELGVSDGGVVWLKKDGSASHHEVPAKKAVTFCGFPEPYGAHGGACLSIEILAGDPVKDEIIFIETHGRGWWGKCLLFKVTGECVVLRSGEEPLGERLVKEPPGGEVSLEGLVEESWRTRRGAVDLEAMAEQKGLKVWESRFFNGYWNPEHGEFERLPQGLCLLPKGDAAVTRKVHKGPCWILMAKAKRYSYEVGTLALTDNIEDAFQELGGEAGACRCLEAKERSREKREQRVTQSPGARPGRVWSLR